MPNISLVDYHTGLTHMYRDSAIVDTFGKKFKQGESENYVPDRKKICKLGESIDRNESIYTAEDVLRKRLAIPDQYQIWNILQDDTTSEMVVDILSNGAIDESDNVINNLSVEAEFKVLDVNLKALLSKLTPLGFRFLYEAPIHDVYNDYRDQSRALDNIKAIHRNRYKVTKDFYDPLLTLKRKNKQGESTLAGHEARIAWEIEYIIKQVRNTLYDFQRIGLHPDREKMKYRRAFIFEREDGLIFKLEIDKYPGIPYFAEIEVSRKDDPNKREGQEFGKTKEDKKAVNDILKSLGLHKNKIVGWGSRNLFLHYGKEYLKI